MTRRALWAGRSLGLLEDRVHVLGLQGLDNLLALAGCAQTPPAPPAAPAPPPRDLPPIEYDGETLGDLLVAETAAQRQSLAVTLEY